MDATDDDLAGGSEFTSLTSKQAAVLDLLANGRTSKEIAGALDLSESAVNRRIELLRVRFGGITRAELARRYRDWPTGSSDRKAVASGGVETDRQTIRLAANPDVSEKDSEDSQGAPMVFRDSLEISIDSPWGSRTMPKVVPGVLDGENAALTRGAAIAIILFGIIASLVLGLAAAGALTDALGR